MRKHLVILGTGGSALDVLDVVDALSVHGAAWKVVGFLDDGRPAGTEHLGMEVLGPLATAPQHREYGFINTIGSDVNYKQRAAIIATTRLERQRFVTLVHPGASVSERAKVGVGVCVNYGVSVGGKAVIGDHVYLCPGAIIGHDATVGDYSIIAPGAVISGFVRIGQDCYIGAGATVRQHISVGDYSLIGMGAVVVKDVQACGTVVGNPAASLRERGSVSTLAGRRMV